MIEYLVILAAVAVLYGLHNTFCRGWYQPRRDYRDVHVEIENMIGGKPIQE